MLKISVRFPEHESFAMQLRLEQVSRQEGTEVHLYPLDLHLEPASLTVLLGATRAGKTSLLRLLAGLDVPSTGKIWVDDRDVTGTPVRSRNVAMVYQQFINYPSLTVAQNIASPLKLSGRMDALEIARRVRDVAKRLQIETFLDRYPAELSGGQQQRVALARALAKSASLMLLDEPLVNLDYKLREELRDEFSTLFASGESTVVYATTEPAEALLLGGYTAVLDAGELLQYGRTAEVFHRPKSIRVARAFSDPPINLLPAAAVPEGVRLGPDLTLNLAEALQRLPALNGQLTLGIRAGALELLVAPRQSHRESQCLLVPAKVALAEVSGSDTYIHLETPLGNLVVQRTGVHRLDLGELVTVGIDPAAVYLFDSQGAMVLAPDSGFQRTEYADG
jgi:glycerol transport system ATP-binding protein